MKMNKKLRSILCLVFALVMTLTALPFGTFAKEPADFNDGSDAYTDYEAGILFTPGSDETERNFSWYSPINAGTSSVLISKSPDLSNATRFYGTFIKTPEGDRSNKVTVTGLEGGTKYYYACCNDAWQSDTYSFWTLSGNKFSALYVTDIHISEDENNPKELLNTSKVFSKVLKTATEKSSLGLILSAGDQASLGLRSEYTALVASDYTRSIPFALTIGNHDRKDVNYKYFKNNPNEYDSFTSSYIGSDYWFVKGNVLFLVMDSNNGDIASHCKFIEGAVEANPDVKWRVAMFHHDLLGQRLPHRESENELLRIIWMPVIDAYDFDLVLTGHSHYYTVSNVVYDRTSVAALGNGSNILNPEGTVYMVSGSLTRPRSNNDGEEPPVGQHIGHSVLTQEAIYNILDFTNDTITVNSYTLDSDELINSYTITKTSQQGGHPETDLPFYFPVIKAIGFIYAIINNIGVNYDYFF